MPGLSNNAKIFIGSQAIAALGIFVYSLATWSSPDLQTFLVILALSAATGAMKVVLPRVQGNLSLSYVFSMWGIVTMSLGETVLLGWASALAQSYWHCKKKPSIPQLLFNLSTTSVSIAAGTVIFKASIFQHLLPNHVVRVFAVSLLYFAVNTISVSTVIGLAERVSIWNVWRTSYLWSFPHYLLSASLVGAVEYLKTVIGLQVALLILPPAYLIYRSFVMHMTKLNEDLERVAREKKHSQETADLHLRTIRALALAIEAKDQTTGEHLHRVQTYAMELAKDFALQPEEMQALHAAAILHDVGKLAVPESIISKPGRLTPSEFAKVKLHTIVGAEIAASVNFPFAVAPLIRSHHEKWDGTGYPDGLKGEEIPIGSRILTAVDCLDALTNDRQYRKAMSLDDAMAFMVSESGKMFDPRVVEVLQRRCRELEHLSQSTMPSDAITLSTNSIVERGAAPDAGYAAGSQGQDHSKLDTNEMAQEIFLLNSIISRIGKAAALDADLCAIEDDLRQLIPFDCMALYQLRSEKLENSFAKGEAESLLTGLSIHSGVGLSGWTVANRTPLLNGNAATEFGVVGKTPPGFTLMSGLSIPLESEFGSIGVLTLYSCQPDAFKHRHLRALLAVGSRLAYQMRLDSSGVVRETRVPARSEDVFTDQIWKFHNFVHSDAAAPQPTVLR